MLIDKKAKQMYMMHIYTQDDAVIISLFRVTGETERQGVKLPPAAGSLYMLGRHIVILGPPFQQLLKLIFSHCRSPSLIIHHRHCSKSIMVWRTTFITISTCFLLGQSPLERYSNTSQLLINRYHLYPLDSRSRCPLETAHHRVCSRHVDQVLLDSEFGTENNALCVFWHDSTNAYKRGRKDDQGV